MFSCEFIEIFKNSFFTGNPGTTASGFFYSFCWFFLPPSELIETRFFGHVLSQLLHLMNIMNFAIGKLYLCNKQRCSQTFIRTHMKTLVQESLFLIKLHATGLQFNGKETYEFIIIF